MPDVRRKKGVSHGQAQEAETQAAEDPQVLRRHGVDVLDKQGVDSYLVSKLCLALRETAKLEGLKGSITVRIDGKVWR